MVALRKPKKPRRFCRSHRRRKSTFTRQPNPPDEESFENFRQRGVNSEPDFAVEQDYFDWELAVTGVSDMKKEIERLQDFGE